MRLNELGLRPATLACLLDAGICTTYELLDHTCRELVWHSEISSTRSSADSTAMAWCCRRGPEAGRRGCRVSAILEVFRLRVVEGCSLKETGARVGIGSERVRQILSVYFGVIGKPPAVKAHRQGQRR